MDQISAIKRKELIEKFKNNPSSFNNSSEIIKNDREIVLELLKESDGNNLHRSKAFPLRELLRDHIVEHRDFKDDVELNKLLIKVNSTFIEAISSEKIKGNLEIFKECIEKYSDRDYFKLASESLRGDKEFALFAVNINPINLEFVTENLKDDCEVVLPAVKSRGSVLEYASDKLKDNYEIVLEAVKNQAGALSSASDRLKDDREIVLTAVKEDRTGICLNHASDRLRDDREIALLAVSGAMGGMGFQYVSDRLRDDREIALKALRNYPANTIAINHVSDHLKNDKEIIEACKQGNITMPANSYRNPFEGVDYKQEKRDDNESPVGFVRKQVKGELEFYPIKLDSKYIFVGDNKKRILSDLDRVIFENYCHCRRFSFTVDLTQFYLYVKSWAVNSYRLDDRFIQAFILRRYHTYFENFTVFSNGAQECNPVVTSGNIARVAHCQIVFVGNLYYRFNFRFRVIYEYG